MPSQTTPPLQDYPGWFPAKLPWWRRRWVQVTGTALVAFAIGVASGGGSSQPSTAMISKARATTLARAAADKARVDAEDHARRAASATQGSVASLQARITKLEAQRDNARAAAARARQQAAAAQAKARAATAALSRPAPTTTVDTSSSSSSTDPRFRTCGEANDNGYGPYRRGVDPEYDWYQDRDGDGVVCES